MLNFDFDSSSIFVRMSKFWLKREPDSLCDISKATILSVVALFFIVVSLHGWYLVFTGGLEVYRDVIHTYSPTMFAIYAAAFLVNCFLMMAVVGVIAAVSVLALFYLISDIVESAPVQKVLSPLKNKYVKISAVISALLGRSCVKVTVRNSTCD